MFFPFQVEKPLHVNTALSEPVKDPRLKDNLHHSVDKQSSKSPKGPKKGKAVSVVNKIMNNLSGKKKSVKKSPLTSPTATRNESIADGKERNWDGTLIKSKDASNTASISTNPKIDPLPTETATSNTKVEKESVGKAETEPNTESEPDLSNPFSAFNGLSSRDMKIAAQAAAIVTAMHQMQSSTTKGPMQPEQSANFAAEFMKLMQGTAQGISPVTTSASASVKDNTTHTTEKTSEISAKPSTSSKTATTTDNIITKQIVSKSSQDKPKVSNGNGRTPDDGFSESPTNKLESVGTVKSEKKMKVEKSLNKKPTKELTKRTKESTQIETKHLKLKAENKNPKDTKTQVKSDEKTKLHDNKPEQTLKVGEKNKTRRQNDNYDKLEPLSKKPKESAVSSDSTERPRKARARSPSRYYCQIEQKTESKKRVEEKEKELSLERKRKDSESDETQDKKAKDHLKLYKQFVGHIEALEKRCKEPNSTINVGTLESVFKQVSLFGVVI